MTYIYSPEHTAYVSYRKDWRKTYKALSEDIRRLKCEFKQLTREDKPVRANRTRYEQWSLSMNASIMLSELAAAKAEWKALLASGHVSRTPASEGVAA